MNYPLAALIVLGFLLSACSEKDRGAPGTDARPAREAGSFLVREEAAYRKRVISEPAYQLTIDLTRGDTHFAGAVDMTFN